ncbi:hypothetical protein VTH06DRAFT_4362 [Thermothelomyces fergusii]|jgi:hypothetical protein
MLTP